MSKVLFEVHTSIVANSILTPEEKMSEFVDSGAMENQLAKEAQSYFADTLAITYYGDAAKKSGRHSKRGPSLRTGLPDYVLL